MKHLSGPTLFLLFICAFVGVQGSVCAAPPRKSASRAGQSPADAAVVSLSVSPAVAALNNPNAVQHLLVTVTLREGSTKDVTDETVFFTSTPKLIAVSKAGEISGVGDGQGVILAKYGGKTASAKIATSGMKQTAIVSFVNDVVPILSRLGCSSGACHGAAQGKGGFRLSLRGYAPELDIVSITRQLGGRRISRENPENSLFLRKPLALVPHRGGKRLFEDSREYRLLLDWLRQGTPGPTGKEASLSRLEILPGDRQMKPGEKQRLLVRATFADGRMEDVTGRALYNSNDVALATVTENGLAQMQRAGETAITAKYMDKLAVMRVLSPFRPIGFPCRLSGPQQLH